MFVLQLKFIVFCLVLVGSLPAWADDATIGYVKALSSEASVTTYKHKVAAQLGTPLFQGSLLMTGPKSSMGVTFKDDAVMSFGPDTELAVDEYLYAPSQGKLKLGTKLAKGGMNYDSGVIAKLQPEAVSVKTPAGTIGVRGTQFVVLVEAT
jgi:hypothetical protein